MQIKILPKNIANQIAAGEVIERPASIIKELVENSIDSGAKAITVKVSGSGLSQITVLDDGMGMDAGDLEMSVRRHATSKLTNISDLEHIASLGFRGEALASIASISKLSITSKKKECQSANKIEIHGGTFISQAKPAPGNYGTFISVSELFYNTPARRKFLKGAATEARHIKMTVLRLAISNPFISFQLFQNERLLFGFQAGDIEECQKRFAFVASNNFLTDSIYFEGKGTRAEVCGWVSRPTVAGATAAQQMRFVNNRYVRDRIIDMAVRIGFRDIMFGNRLPPYLIYLSIDPSAVDVNVHPSKEEVRFANPDEIKELVKRSVRTALAQDGVENQLQSRSFNIGLHQENKSDRANSADDLLAEPGNEKELLFSSLDSVQKNNVSGSEHLALEEDNLFDRQGKLDLGSAIGQIHDIFIISQNPKGIIIIDMHAAHERINYESLKIEWDKNKKISSQKTMLPLILEVPPEDAENIETMGPELELLGFDIIRCGETRIAIHSHPAFLSEKNLKKMFSPGTEDDYFWRDCERIEEGIEKILADIACRSSLKAYDKLSIKEMNTLLRNIEGTRNSGYCSHGRPVWRFMSLSELDKIFLRGR